MTDDLDVPLGLGPKKKPRRLGLLRYLPHLVAGGLAAALLGFVGWTIIADDPLGGEPIAVASIGNRPIETTKGEANVKGPADAPAAAPAAAQPESPAGTKVVTVIDGMSGKRQQFAISAGGSVKEQDAPPGKVVVTPVAKVPAMAAAEKTAPDMAKPAPQEAPKAQPAESGAAANADARLAQTSRHGTIPKIGADGGRASEVYASPLARTAGAGGAQVAIVMGRLGVSAKGTEDALSKLPAAVSVAFAPYGADLARWVGLARAGGREVLLQVPMEPFDYPDNDPGPQTLLTSLSPDQNVDRLHWFMSRFQGYVGIGNYMGARFAANEPAVSTMMREVAKRGLLYFDDGSITRTLVGQIAAANNVPFARADIVIDAGRAPADIDAALARLETLARERGSAVGVAIPLPGSIDRIAQWANGAAARGITLVPISVIANKAKSS